MLSRSEASLARLEGEILRFGCGLAQDDNWLPISADMYYVRTF